MKQWFYQYVTRLQIVLFSCCLILAIAYPFKYIGELQPLLLLVMAPMMLLLVNQLLAKIDKIKSIHYWVIGLYVVLVSLQLLLFTLFPAATAYNDGAQIKNEALSLYYTGTFSGERYFLTYPNNINITLLLFSGYKLLPFLNFYQIDHLMTFISYHIMLVSMLIVTYRQFNLYQVVKLLILFLLTLPLHIYLLYFYTDTMVWWVPATILLIIGWKKHDHTINYVQFILLCSLLIVGYLIKQNIVLLLPALMIYLWYCGAWKKAVMLLMTFILAIQLISPMMMHVQSKYGFYQDDYYRFPYVHWVMMGISDSTFYNWHDYQYTYQQPTYEDKVHADLQLIKERLVERPLWRTLLVPFISLDTTWSEGTLYAVNSVRVNTEGNDPLWSWLLGNQKQVVLYLMQLIYIVVLSNLVMSLRRIDPNKKIYMFLQIILLGVMTFHMFWESNPRYIVIWYPFILLLSLHHPVKLAVKWPTKMIISVVILIFTVIAYMATTRTHYAIYHDYFVKTGIQNSAYATDYYLKQQQMIQQAKVIRQTFQSHQTFNVIKIIATSSDISQYQVQLKDLASQQIIWQQIVTQEDFKYNKKLKTSELVLSFKTIQPDTDKQYQLILNRRQGQWQVALSPNQYLDSYTQGQVQLDDHILSTQDLIFSVGKE